MYMGFGTTKFYIELVNYNLSWIFVNKNDLTRALEEIKLTPSIIGNLAFKLKDILIISAG
jgi:hypothetical protein